MLLEKIKKELDKNFFPDLGFFVSGEVLDNAMEILEKLLLEEKEEFYEKINKKYFGLDSDDSNLPKLDFDFTLDKSYLGEFFHWINHFDGVMSTEKTEKIIEDFEPKYVEFSNEVSYNKRYYEIIKYIFENDETLNPEQKRILQKSVEHFEFRGINFPEEKQEKLKKINLESSAISTQFGQNALKSKEEFFYVIEDEKLLGEMPEDVKNIAKNLAKEKGKEGFYFSLNETLYGNILKYCLDRKIREKFYLASNNIASEGKYSNKEIVRNILNLRLERAKLLDLKDFSEVALRFKMAESKQQIINLYSEIAEKARKKAENFIEELKSYFDLKEFAQYDLAFYSRIYKNEKYDFDEKELRNYFEYENVLAGLFEIAKKLYGIEMKKLSNVNSYAENVDFYEVYKDGKLQAYFLTDYFAREGKRSGAWEDTIRGVELVNGKKEYSIISNACEFQKNDFGKTLLTENEVRTIFHEFGHALHDILFSGDYSSLQGTGVERDFVELPSQLMEYWAREKESLITFAKHFETGEKIPDELLQKLKELKLYGVGNFIYRQLNLCFIDFEMNSISEEIKSVEDLDKISEKIHDKFNISGLSIGKNMYCDFGHIFNGGYAFGYYSYMWADMIVANIGRVFREKGMFDPETAKKYYEEILSVGARKDGLEMFRNFMGKDISSESFILEYGLD